MSADVAGSIQPCSNVALRGMVVARSFYIGKAKASTEHSNRDHIQEPTACINAWPKGKTLGTAPLAGTGAGAEFYYSPSRKSAYSKRSPIDLWLGSGTDAKPRSILTSSFILLVVENISKYSIGVPDRTMNEARRATYYALSLQNIITLINRKERRLQYGTRYRGMGNSCVGGVVKGSGIKGDAGSELEEREMTPVSR
ncbi:hypothetical protein CBL_13395 [Carabus blaptoides fortunei]